MKLSWDSLSNIWIRPWCPNVVTSSSGLISSSPAIRHERISRAFSLLVSHHHLWPQLAVSHSVRVCGQIGSQFSTSGLICSSIFKWVLLFFPLSTSLVAYIFSCDLLLSLVSSKRCSYFWVFPSRLVSLGICWGLFNILMGAINRNEEQGWSMEELCGSLPSDWQLSPNPMLFKWWCAYRLSGNLVKMKIPVQ